MINNTKSLNVVSVPRAQSKRIEFIDAMRGFTIFLVVLNHVALHCLNISESTPTFYRYLIQVEMPMFCLISGFVFYKKDTIWSFQHIIGFFKKKAFVFLLSPLLFYIIYLHTRGIPFIDGVLSDSKYGYWYTYTLMIFFAIYVLVNSVLKDKLADIVLLAIGFTFYLSNWPPLIEILPIKEELLSFMSFRHWSFFLYFAIGILIRKYFAFVEDLLNSKWFLCISISFYMLGNAFEDIIPLRYSIKQLPLILAGLCVCWSFFRNKQNVLSSKTGIGRFMLFIGRRTLDIYLIHFFLLPENLSFIRVFNECPVPILDLTVCSIVAIIIIAICLLIGSIIRLSPVLAHCVFGEKMQETK